MNNQRTALLSRLCVLIEGMRGMTWAKTVISFGIAATIALIGFVLATASAEGGEEETGAELMLRNVEQEIAHFEVEGMSPDDPTLVNLRQARDGLLEEIAAGPPPPPDPKVVAEILNRPDGVKPVWDSGKIPCEGGLGFPDMSQVSDYVCIAVPQENGNLIHAWITDEGKAWIGYQVFREKGSDAWFDIPVVDKPSSADVAVVGEIIELSLAEDTVTFDTGLWRAELASGG